MLYRYVYADLKEAMPAMTKTLLRILLLLALVLNREYDPPTALSFAVLVMLLVNPMAITSVSLQLSAGCMVGIFLFSGKIQQFFLNKWKAYLINENRINIFRKYFSSFIFQFLIINVIMPRNRNSYCLNSKSF